MRKKHSPAYLNRRIDSSRGLLVLSSIVLAIALVFAAMGRETTQLYNKVLGTQQQIKRAAHKRQADPTVSLYKNTTIPEIKIKDINELVTKEQVNALVPILQEVFDDVRLIDYRPQEKTDFYKSDLLQFASAVPVTDEKFNLLARRLEDSGYGVLKNQLTISVTTKPGPFQSRIIIAPDKNENLIRVLVY